jgi:hypothetical protein
MRLFRIILLLVVGTGIAWAQSAPSGGDQRSDDQPGEDQPGVEQLSQEELDAEMERMEDALGESGLSDSGEVKEFIPTKPLAADLPVALPSDI